MEQGTEETGAVNTVAGMIPGLPLPAFDTLGESFSAVHRHVCRDHSAQPFRQKALATPARRTVDYASDPIVAPMCRFLIPVILVFGIYILLNGHLSPGGGFSGGAILAAGLMLFAMVWERCSGLRRAARPRELQTVVLCSLGFYLPGQELTPFYTGANHLHSVISAPGHRLFSSAGLILPLNVAVGFVVCCTVAQPLYVLQKGEL
ncbi:MAG: MnhB domain-containing protein [Oscillospiraceae bacterium]